MSSMLMWPTYAEQIESARRAVKRIRLETSQIQTGIPGSPQAAADMIERAGSPIKATRTPPPRALVRVIQFG